MTKVIRRFCLGQQAVHGVVRGIGSVVDLMPNRGVSIGTPVDDKRNIRSDWAVVGRDIRGAAQVARAGVKR